MKYTEQQKKEILDWYQEYGQRYGQRWGGMTATCKHFNISDYTLQSWLKPEYYNRVHTNTRKLIKHKCQIDPEYKRKFTSQVNNRIMQRIAKDPKYKEKHQLNVNRANRKRRALALELNENYTKEDEQYTLNLFEHKCVICGITQE